MFSDSFNDFESTYDSDEDYDIYEDNGNFSDEEFEIDKELMGDGLDEMDDSQDVNFDIDSSLSDEEIQIAGSLDGEHDAENGEPMYSQFGGSVDLENLTEDQKEIYETAYHQGFDSN